MLRKAKSTELDEIMLIIEDGREFLRQQGINQWQHGSPSKETIEQDIKEQTSYVYEIDRNIVATAMLTNYDRDYENYPTLWSKCDNYLVIHRVATLKNIRNQGIGRQFLSAIVEFVKKENIDYIRIDTHKDNKIMRKFLSDFGFVELGEIKLTMKNNSDDKERIAYEIKV
ncbi:GNAT family N-acetyltransferase [Gemella morbillorum]|uniref:GNAT family N-acetyltransferase n=1 Tax=Gemella morbillorum TaxID=29391 RepID=UPI0028D10AA1|nr:GNAT family N-acetyltransferase [Gemella morbillorum]